jgi:penicillin-binding protein 1A
MATAFGTLATGGQRVDPVPAITVADAEGNILWQADPRPEQVIDPPVAAAANDILQDAVRFGTGNAATIDRPQIGKTGTDDANVNAWFVGSVPQLTAAIWVGFHEGQIPMVPPRTRTTVYGGTWPAQIWRLLMARSTASMPIEFFPTPEVDYVEVAVDITKQPPCLPNAYTLPQHIDTVHLVSGTEPTETCAQPSSLQEVIVPSVVGLARPEAADALEAAGFYVRVEAAASTQPEGTVISQSPTGGTHELQTGTVVITVAQPIEP